MRPRVSIVVSVRTVLNLEQPCVVVAFLAPTPMVQEQLPVKNVVDI